MSKDEGLKEGYDFCIDSAGNLIRCGVVNEKTGEYKYCFKKKVEKCHYDENKQICIGYCAENARCVMKTDYEICYEECKKKVEDCMSTMSSEECRKVYDECISQCKPSCKCIGYACPEGCRCLDTNEVEKYKEEGFNVVRCSDKPCGDGKYCYKVAKECYFDYEKEQCVGSCKVGICNLNTIHRDPDTNKIVYAECRCKPISVCSEGCACLTREEAIEKFSNPVLCNNQPCGVESAGLATANAYINKYCFREGMEVCHYDREKQQCVGSCEKGECKMFEDAYGNPFCGCLAKLEAVSGTIVERVLPDTAQPLTCIPVKLVVKPGRDLKRLSIVETYPSDFTFKGANVPTFYYPSIIFFSLEDENGLDKQTIEYKLCLPRDAMGEYYFKGIWESENKSKEITGDNTLRVVPQLTNWPPCPVTDQMLGSFLDQWSKGELSDLELLQAVEVWSEGC
ncbi:hypothetical protein DRP05_02500 [Archaeoglobales archaeon]|nr:MAG: hypothetical protein DRP05_02500 [Archaeoglobales archaeon]